MRYHSLSLLSYIFGAEICQLTSVIKMPFLATESGLPDGARDDALYHDEAEEEEKGMWHYLVVDKDGCVPRRVASYDKSHVAEGKYDDGVVVAVTKRIRRGWTYWLGLRDKAEWLFDVDPADKTLVMMEVNVHEGVQDVVASQPLQILPRASLDATNKNVTPIGNIEVGEAYKVVKRVSLVGGLETFIQISNGRGWVLEPLQVHQDGFERGCWDYMAIDPVVAVIPALPPQLSIGGIASTNSGLLGSSEAGIEEGTVIQVSERVLTDRTRMLRTPLGWACENLFSQRKCKPRRVMMEIPVERGRFVYRVLVEKGVAIRSRCSFAENAKTGIGPLGGELVECNQRVRCGETTFLKMSDGRGWLFDVKNGKHILEVVEEAQDGGLPPTYAPASFDDGLDLGEGFELDMKTPRPPDWK